MKMLTRFPRAWVTTAMVAVSAAGLLAQAPAAPGSPFKSVEYLLLGDATRGAGEPMIAVDPTNPKNLIAVAMGTLGELPPPPPGGSPGTENIPRSTITWLAVTHDGGTTWKVGELPLQAGTLNRCPDAFADVTREGFFIAGCEPRQTIGAKRGMSALVVSDDRGDTWSAPVEIVSSWGANRFAPGLKPLFRAASPWDRPYTFIDDSTDVIYGAAFGGQADNGAGGTRSQAYVTASTDGGRSFGTVYAWDSPDYPQMSRGQGMTAQHGRLFVNYVASKAPASEGATCPCTVLGVSRDMGKTFTYHVLKNVPPGQGRGGAPGPPAGAPGAGAAPAGGPPAGPPRRGGPPVVPTVPTTVVTGLSADPTKDGRLAMLLDIEGPSARFEVAVSEDYGTSWAPAVVAGQTPGAVAYSKPAFEYSRGGVLGLMWRGLYADGSYDIWASISRDGGKTFSKALPVSHGRSPAALPPKSAGNDDISDLSMDKENLHLIWGDFRTGFMGSWYGRVPFSAFEFPAR